ncbi:Linalool 8-monooxygenase [Sphingobium chlorophenolicum L-1]|uniref:Linalool 8-monooxygenase n=1 Tax=Sphingobium chlorophenolicum L-1 TaxID=690566 RepID=F6F3E0_SPHCR|nr:cytochrome P450 [Sphingobium chlorophenolicum]AEG50952.1 Linalool 8-monooxygenase [Sphingobium chlorophenolicum L-1]
MDRQPTFGKYSPFSPDQVDNPFPVLAEARATAPVFFSEELGMWVVTRYADVRYIYENPEIFSSSAVLSSRTDLPEAIVAEFGDWRPPLDKEVVMTDPPRHTRLKRLMMRAFTPGRILKFEPWIREIAEGLLDGLEGVDECDIVERYTAPLPPLIIGRLMGVPAEDALKFGKWVGNIVVLAGTWQLSEEETIYCWRGIREFEEYVQGLIAERRKNLGEDVVSYLIDAKGDEGEAALDDEELVHNVCNIAGAGADTTGQWLATTLYCLLSGDREWDRVANNRALVPAALEESLRYRGVVRSLVRKVNQDVTLGTVQIPAGDFVLFNLASANRDGAAISDPDTFDIDRKNVRGHIAFGHGAHTCLGASLARLEAKVAIESLMNRFPNLQLASGQGDLKYQDNLMIPGVKSLRVKLR